MESRGLHVVEDGMQRRLAGRVCMGPNSPSSCTLHESFTGACKTAWAFPCHLSSHQLNKQRPLPGASSWTDSRVALAGTLRGTNAGKSRRSCGPRRESSVPVRQMTCISWGRFVLYPSRLAYFSSPSARGVRSTQSSGDKPHVGVV